ncbi:MAG: glycosyltransferase family 4 protein [Sulfuricella sp.]|nr:glycosyltransferase family 4 protein [Sulfuricella sp.]
MERKNLIFIECGTTMSSHINTGIQRVVRNIVEQAGSVSGELGMHCYFVEFANNGFLELSDQSVAATSKVKLFLMAIDQIIGAIAPKRIYYGLRNRIKSWVKRLTRRNAGRDIYQILDSWQQKPKDKSEQIPDRPILLLLDSTWDTKMWEAVDRFRSKGGHVCAVLYDLIPFTHPDTIAESTRIAHTQWWAEAPLHVDSIMCISRSVRDDYLAWQERQKLARKLMPEKVGYFYLGAELKQNDPVIQILSSSVPTYLVVGSLEPRKNHALILDAFEQLWQQGHEVNLAIVGAFGWKSEKLLTRIQNHPEHGHRLFLIRDASDRDLTALYDKSEALIIASLAEGFGLPIVEAFQRGTKVICSDIPVFREIAGDQAVYFDLASPASLASRVTESAESLGRDTTQQRNVTMKWITWRESTVQLLSRLQGVSHYSHQQDETR